MAKEETGDTIRPDLPTGRVKKIMKLDKDINKVNSEALYLVSCSTEHFLRLLAEKSAAVAVEKRKKTVKLEHIRVAVKRHRPASDFLLDSLPLPPQLSDHSANEKRPRNVAAKTAPAGARRIDDFFHKPANEDSVQVNES